MLRKEGVCAAAARAHDICFASRNNRRQRDELGFDYFFESHDGIQTPPFIYTLRTESP